MSLLAVHITASSDHAGDVDGRDQIRRDEALVIVWALLRHIRRRRATLLLTTSLLVEYEATCHLAEHRLAAGLDGAAVDWFLDGLVRLAEPVEVHFRWRPQLRDPGDEMVLEAAVNGRADVLTTFNRRDYGAAPGRFGIEVLRPGEVLRRMLP